MKSFEQLRTLMELSALINSTLEISEIQKRAIKSAMKLLDAEAASLILVHPASGELFFEVALGGKGKQLKKVRLKKGEGIAGWVAEKGKAVLITDCQKDKRFSNMADERSHFCTRNMVCVPVRSKDKTLGVLQAINKKRGVFDETDKDALSALGNQVAIAIENAHLYEELRETFFETAEALAETIEKRDPYTGGHTKRVMNYCDAMGKAIGLSRKELDNLRLASILHDIGKIGVRDDILMKEARLTAEENEKMTKHSTYGAEILAHIRQLRDIIPGVRSHHERIDGTGYPDNLRSTDIPLIARLIAVADTFDAMTTDRPYRKALSTEAALRELTTCSGKQFDAEIVAVFTDLFTRNVFSAMHNPGGNTHDKDS